MNKHHTQHDEDIEEQDIQEEPGQSKEEEYLNNWKRAEADLINYRKQEAERAQALIKYGNESLIIEIIDVYDNLRLALSHTPPDTDKNWLVGIMQVAKQFEQFLEKHGVKKIEVGAAFDPAVHEAIETVEGDEDRVEEVRSGYTMHDKVIRPARVKVVTKTIDN